MAEKLISPGVFTQEKDLTYLPEGISQIGAAIIGPTEKGQAFVPVQVTSQDEFQTKFGSGTEYTTYTVQEYLKSAGIVTIVRVLGIEAYTRKFFTLSITGSVGAVLGSKVLAVLSATGSDSVVTTASLSSGSTIGAFVLNLNGVGYSASFDSRKTQYISNVLSGVVPAEIVYNFPTFQSSSNAVSSSAGIVISDLGTPVSMSDDGYSKASTSWIISQAMSGVYYQLFKFHTLADGDSANREIKVGIFDIKIDDEVSNSDYGQFSVVVRKYSDTDARPEILETFNNCTLDPDSINYLPRIIGDRRKYYTTIGGESQLVNEGDWPNISSYIRVEMNTTPFPKSAVPCGFEGYENCYNSLYIPTMSYVVTQTINNQTNTRAYRGVNFSDRDVDSYFTEIPKTTTTGSNRSFHLDDYVITGSNSALSDAWTSVATRKFIFGFQGGSDGIDPRIPNAQGSSILSTNTQQFDCSVSTTHGSRAYKKAIDSISNPDEVDVNLLILPGILHKYHNFVSTYAISFCEERGDCFYIMDSAGIMDSVDDTVDSVLSLDTNYAATYYPWVRISDPSTGKPIWVPPSVVLGGVYSFNDKTAQEWFAPAGLNRGGINATEVFMRLTQSQKDSLYNSRVNPIVAVAGQGIVVWGQKTLQSKASALDRINVRRLLINLKKFIASASRYLVFEQNVTATRNRFLNIVNPYMESVQNRAGLYAFKVIMDETINTADLIDRGILYGKIYIQPSRVAEYILLDFNILPTGATFPS